jgi:4-hydroxythreonine-4-phosphate dehydrogenase
MPVAKSSLYLAGWKYPGHTEMLADYCQSQEHLMILMTDRVRVALATIHIPLSRINQILSSELIISKTITLHECLKTDFGIDSPAIAVLGLNPHAGEDGALGEEENKIILPAIKKLNVSGIRAEGPFPADGFFAHGAYRNYDAILAMYHDQGLIPLKMLAAGGGVNFTAGLPIVRTSPDHGTAYSIAGKNEANSQSSYDAIISAIEIVKRRKSIL